MRYDQQSDLHPFMHMNPLSRNPGFGPELQEGSLHAYNIEPKWLTALAWFVLVHCVPSSTDSSIWFDTINLGRYIVYHKESQVRISKLRYGSVPASEDCFYLSKQGRPK